jgi:hypothetical protein
MYILNKIPRNNLNISISPHVKLYNLHKKIKKSTEFVEKITNTLHEPYAFLLFNI